MKRIYTPLPFGKSNAQQYYRQIVPLTYLEKGYNIEIFRDQLDMDLSQYARFQTIATADVAFLFHAWAPWFNKMLEATYGIKPAKDRDGVLRYPPAIVVTLDDDIWAVDPLNPAYSFYGGLDEQGIPLGGGAVEVKDEDGNRLAFWQDGINMSFSDAANNHALISAQMRMAQKVIVPNEALKSAVIQHYGPGFASRITVIPNMCDLSAFPKANLVEDGTVRIGMTNTLARLYDLKTIIDPLRRVMNKYPNTVYVHFGATPPEWLNLPRVEVVPWTDFRAWPHQLVLQRLDIMLAPMLDTPFNASRSNTKLYDAVGPHRPAALLAPNIGIYKEEILDGQTGLLYEDVNFEEKLSKLVEDGELRRSLGMEGRKWVAENRAPEKLVSELWKVLRGAWEARRDVPYVED